MVKAIKMIYCTTVRKRVFISVQTRIVNCEVVPVIDSAHCRYHTIHGCNNAWKCERIEAANQQWIAEGMPVV